VQDQDGQNINNKHIQHMINKYFSLIKAFIKQKKMHLNTTQKWHCSDCVHKSCRGDGPVGNGDSRRGEGRGSSDIGTRRINELVG